MQKSQGFKTDKNSVLTGRGDGEITAQRWLWEFWKQVQHFWRGESSNLTVSPYG